MDICMVFYLLFTLLSFPYDIFNLSTCRKWVVRDDEASLIFNITLKCSISAHFVRRFSTHLMRLHSITFLDYLPPSLILCPLRAPPPPSPLTLLLSSPSVRLLQAALLPPCLPHVLPLEDMHLGSCCTLLCVLINILAASRRKWVFLWANPLWGGWLEYRKRKVIEKEGQAHFFYARNCPGIQ